ncbi:MAG: imidazole glycerol phosphate synthase subunit HisH [Steroidobacteraceae bacterium]
MSVDVAVIDSGGANLASIGFALDRLGAKAVVTTDHAVIRSAPRVLLPGVGAAEDAMQRLSDAGLVSLIPELTQPVLGVCLGMQLLFSASEESSSGALTQCLGILPGTVARLPGSPATPVPHMGWNRSDRRVDDPLFQDIGPEQYFYFVHSFAAPVVDSTIAATHYGTDFTAAVRWRNFRGVQFHPERSAAAGSRLLANFLRLH